MLLQYTPNHPLNCDGSHQRPATDRVGVVRQPALTPYTPLFQPPPEGVSREKKDPKEQLLHGMDEALVEYYSDMLEVSQDPQGRYPDRVCLRRSASPGCGEAVADVPVPFATLPVPEGEASFGLLSRAPGGRRDRRNGSQQGLYDPVGGLGAISFTGKLQGDLLSVSHARWPRYAVSMVVRTTERSERKISI